MKLLTPKGHLFVHLLLLNDSFSASPIVQTLLNGITKLSKKYGWTLYNRFCTLPLREKFKILRGVVIIGPLKKGAFLTAGLSETPFQEIAQKDLVTIY